MPITSAGLAEPGRYTGASIVKQRQTSPLCYFENKDLSQYKPRDMEAPGSFEVSHEEDIMTYPLKYQTGVRKGHHMMQCYVQT